jgi:RNA polymerase sigma factor (sigma-70 family)
MDENTLNSRLSRISTIWTLLHDPLRSSSSKAGDVRLALIQRYQRAVYRYLLGALRDLDAADEVFQDFALRVVQGAFSKANPERGRFRDYLRTTLIHLATDYQNKLRRRPASLENGHAEAAVPPCDAAADDERFVQSWREEILARVWESLEEDQRQGGQPYYSILRFRSDNSGASSAEMAEHFNEQFKPERPFTDAGVRKMLQRAKMRFADLLISEVSFALENPSLDELEQELIDLDLLPYCRSALMRRRNNG